MAPSQVQLYGGHFQDLEGNVLAKGALRLALSQDEALTDNAGQLCGGVQVTMPLDANGNVDTTASTYVWPTDQMLPAGAFYKVWAYKADGQLAWGENYNLTVTSGATFDLDTWIPNLYANNVVIASVIIEGGLNIVVTYNGAVATVAVQNWNVDVAAYTPGTLSNNQELIRWNSAHNVTFPANFAGSYGTADVASSGTVSCTIYKISGGVTSQVGLLTFESTSVGTFSSSAAATFVPGDVGAVFGPASADADLAGISFTLAANRTA